MFEKFVRIILKLVAFVLVPKMALMLSKTLESSADQRVKFGEERL